MTLYHEDAKEKGPYLLALKGHQRIGDQHLDHGLRGVTREATIKDMKYPQTVYVDRPK